MIYARLNSVAAWWSVDFRFQCHWWKYWFSLYTTIQLFQFSFWDFASASDILQFWSNIYSKFYYHHLSALVRRNYIFISQGLRHSDISLTGNFKIGFKLECAFHESNHGFVVVEIIKTAAATVTITRFLRKTFLLGVNILLTLLYLWSL